MNDLISRQAVNKLRIYNLVGGVHTVSLDDINQLPSVKVNGDLIGRKDLLKELEKWDWQDAYLPIHFAELVADLPSVEKTAEWIIKHKVTNSGSFWEIKCSNCEIESDSIYRYCPQCGARMKKSGEEK